MSGVIFISHKAVLTIAVILKSNWQSVCMWEVDGENLWGGNSTPVDSRSQQKWRGRHHGCGFQASEGWTASDVWSVQLLRNLVFFYLKIQVFEFGICLSSSSHQKEQDISLQLNFLKLLFPSESNPRNEIWTDIFENGRTLHNSLISQILILDSESTLDPPPPQRADACNTYKEPAKGGWVFLTSFQEPESWPTTDQQASMLNLYHIAPAIIYFPSCPHTSSLNTLLACNTSRVLVWAAICGKHRVHFETTTKL